MRVKDNITVIPAIRRMGNSSRKEERPKLRVAAYCRVSTDSEEQASSYDTQVEHYTHYIKTHDGWELAGIYADDGISGTNTKKRDEFNRMIQACMDGTIDMIITKSISRFARNTLDCLKYIRQLKEKNISVYFEKENINTMDSKGEVLLTIMASLAQQESESLSKNVKLGLQFRYQNGQVQVNHNRFMGYTKDENGNLVIEPSEALVIRQIFFFYLEGYSLKQIGEKLEEQGILTAAGKSKWRPETIRKILQNEKYMGDALLQKTYTVDVLSKKRVKNVGIVPQYYVEGNHEAIIPKDLFMQVQEEMIRRTTLKSGEKKRNYSSKYALTSVVCCSKCQATYRRVAWKNRGKASNVWRCVTRVEKGPEVCDAPTIKEDELQKVVVKAINSAIHDRKKIIKELKATVREVVIDRKSITKIDSQLKQLQQQLVGSSNDEERYNTLVDEIMDLQNQKQEVITNNALQDGVKKRIEEMQLFLDEQASLMEEYDELLVRKLINKITVQENRFEVEFKSGTVVDIWK